MLRLFKDNPSIITFGILASFFSGPGQTFLVSLFRPLMQEELHISNSNFGLLYMVGTLSGAFALPVLGRLLDKTELLKFTLLMAALLAGGCLVLSLSNTIWMLILGLCLIRCFGQGAMGMISSTTMSRVFITERGKALSLSGLGFPIGEALFPVILVYWIAMHGWRSGWTLLSLLLLIFFMPIVTLLLHFYHRKGRSIEKKQKTRPKKSWQAGEVLKDYRFYIQQLSGVLLPALLTAIFLYQDHLSLAKNWSPETFALTFWWYALFRGLMSFFVGPLIDRFSARVLMKIILIPFCLGLALLYFTNGVWVAPAFLALTGTCVGLQSNVRAAFFAEAYGADNLGGIRGISAFFVIAGTAISPPLFGWLIDQGVSVVWMTGIFAIICFVGCLVNILVSEIYREAKA